MITPKLLRDWNACWTDEAIRVRICDAGISPRDVADDETISLDDRLWVLCRSLWYLDESAARGFAVESALLVSHLAGDEDDQAQHAALCARLLEIEDLPEDQRVAARAAAWVAARDAAWVAARAAAWVAARDAARAAAWDAAWAAAWDAARDAAWAAAWDAARVAARVAARDAARDAAIRKAIVRAIEWLGDYADGWEEP